MPRKVVTDDSYDCIDCRVDRTEYFYIVSDEIWKAAGMKPKGGMLCIGCLEARLGRPMQESDFPKHIPANWARMPVNRSPRLQAILDKFVPLSCRGEP